MATIIIGKSQRALHHVYNIFSPFPSGHIENRNLNNVRFQFTKNWFSSSFFLCFLIKWIWIPIQWIYDLFSPLTSLASVNTLTQCALKCQTSKEKFNKFCLIWFLSYMHICTVHTVSKWIYECWKSSRELRYVNMLFWLCSLIISLWFLCSNDKFWEQKFQKLKKKDAKLSLN